MSLEARSTIVKEKLQDDDVVGPPSGASLYLNISGISDWKIVLSFRTFQLFQPHDIFVNL